MVIDAPEISLLPQLRQLWKLAFGDTDAFLDSFVGTAFSPERCRCVMDGETVAAMLYWFDCQYAGENYAYLYAVATHPDYRKRGLCHALMADTHDLLASRGYAGAVLVPQEEPLRKLYSSMGYKNAGTVSEFTCAPAETAEALRQIDGVEYARLRRQYLPEGGVIQERESIAFLGEYAQFYAGADLLLAAYREEDHLWGMELLGNRKAAPGILTALGCVRGRFRTPGGEIPFAMFHPLKKDAVPPVYFGLAFD